MLVPVVLVIVLGTIQVGLWAYGRTAAAHAAIATAEEAALTGVGASEARAVGHAIAGAAGLTDLEINLEVTATDARATVRGRMPTFFDLGQTRVSEQATRPLERVVRP